jgi:tetratricopeptide (TPR) repeat protein
MQIIHKIDAFLNAIFPEITDNSTIVVVLTNFYSYGSFRPSVRIEDDFVVVDLDIKSISYQENNFRNVITLCENNNFSEAKPILLELIEKNPTNSEYHRILGQIQSEQGDQDEAINALIDSLRWNSSNGWALMMMGNIFARHKKDLTTALKYYDQAIFVNKADHITLANIAYILFQENKLEEAKKYALEAVKLKENYLNTSFILSLITEKEGDLQAAFNYTIQSIKQAINPDALYQNAVKQAFDLANKIGNEYDAKNYSKHTEVN